ncbi:MAG: ABC transporter permease [Caldilineaceae bacterium]|nr:ABC transporter permease [Caldilineaceae bacterium]MCB9158417.1 ABC transporter permease [Caldilineaceae bacterium]
MSFYLALKEVLHNRWRFLLIALIVALITTLVLFIAALAEGLGAGNREYIEKLNGELVVYQANVDLSIAASRIGRSRLAEIRRVEGVADVGQIGTSSATVVLPDNTTVDVSLLGVEPGKPGEPEVVTGRGLERSRSNEALIDRSLAERTGLGAGDTLTIKSIQGTKEELYDLTIVGVTDGRQFFLQPSVFLPYLTFEKVRPGSGAPSGNGELVSNIVAVKLQNPADWQAMAKKIEAEVSNVQAVDRKTAYEATPGYTAQQSTLDTQRFFTLFIGVLVIGGFFQIQTLQKVAQIGMLKAIGASNWTIAWSSIVQIVTINALGVLIGTVGTVLLTLTFPSEVPIILTGRSVVTAVTSLMLIGPLGGLVSVFALLKIEPLTALGLAQ